MGTDSLKQLSLFKEDKVKHNHNGGTKQCDGCKEYLPYNFFPCKAVLSGGQGALGNLCRSCSNEYVKEQNIRKQNTPPPSDDYKCPICLRKKEETRSRQVLVDMKTYEEVDRHYGKKQPFVLDHNHDTGKVRGWLCNKCNSALGRLDDSVIFLKRAINYLEKNDGNY